MPTLATAADGSQNSGTWHPPPHLEEVELVDAAVEMVVIGSSKVVDGVAVVVSTAVVVVGVVTIDDAVLV